jgi:hypothetical protein
MKKKGQSRLYAYGVYKGHSCHGLERGSEIRDTLCDFRKVTKEKNLTYGGSFFAMTSFMDDPKAYPSIFFSKAVSLTLKVGL